MNTQAAVREKPPSSSEQLEYGRQILLAESHAVAALAERLDATFTRAVEMLFACGGNVIVSGMGKAGLVGQKLSATFASTGTRSHFLHPGEAFHGDLGRIHRSDLVLVLSQRGETEEVTRLLPSLADFGVPLIAVTSRPTSTLGSAATLTLDLGSLAEACSLGLAPSTSTTAMLALGDALALVTSRMRNFQAEDFARFHPGGSLGRKLSKVEDHMRDVSECRTAPDAQTVRQVFTECTRPGRRSGAIMLLDADGCLSGIFTDSDLARLFERHVESALDRPIRDVMTTGCATVASGSMMPDAIEIMAQRKISELPVLDPTGRPVGMIDITDVAGMLPEGPWSAETVQSTASTKTPRIQIYPDPNVA